MRGENFKSGKAFRDWPTLKATPCIANRLKSLAQCIVSIPKEVGVRHRVPTDRRFWRIAAILFGLVVSVSHVYAMAPSPSRAAATLLGLVLIDVKAVVMPDIAEEFSISFVAHLSLAKYARRAEDDAGAHPASRSEDRESSPQDASPTAKPERRVTCWTLYVHDPV